MANVQQVAILVNSPPGGVLGPRAGAFARRLGAEFPTEVIWREGSRPQAVFAFVSRLRHIRPNVVYVTDLGYSPVIAAFLYRAATSCALIVETGDPLAELLFAAGRVGTAGRLGIQAYERIVLTRADHVVVRGSGLTEYVARLGVTRVDTVPDGVDTQLFHPMPVENLRKELGLDGAISIGVMGTLNWSKRLQWGYGSELVDALALLKHLPVRGLVVGGGPGRNILERRAIERGVRERIVFAGHIPHESLSPYINAMDICLSTQTNDWVGRARTTAKLPLFLACGRFVLASRVGEAARILPEEMLVEYGEGFDPAYPERLARRIERLVDQPQLLRLGERSRLIAETEFDYDVLAPRVAALLRSALIHRVSRH